MAGMERDRPANRDGVATAIGVHQGRRIGDRNLVVATIGGDGAAKSLNRNRVMAVVEYKVAIAPKADDGIEPMSVNRPTAADAKPHDRVMAAAGHEFERTRGHHDLVEAAADMEDIVASNELHRVVAAGSGEESPAVKR